MEDLARDEVLAAVDRVVEELLERGSVRLPPIDAIVLAETALGFVIRVEGRPGKRSRARPAEGPRELHLPPESPAEQQQALVAQAIGDHFKRELLDRLGIEPGQASGLGGVSLPNLFAPRLLVPTCWFAAEAPALGYDVLALKERYTTASHEMIAWRLLDLPDPCIITVLEDGTIRRRRSNAWPTKRELSSAEVKCQRHVHKHGRPHRVQEDGWTVEAWPVHEGDRKREILRSVVDSSEMT